MQTMDRHPELRENAVVDAEENLKYPALFVGISGFDEFLRRSAAKDIARCLHPVAGEFVFSKDFSRTVPDRHCIRMFELSGKLLSGRCCTLSLCTLHV